ncbi:alpha/beta hydrolase family protein [Streptomyces sp. NPDC056069]|uniref:alpha/beta hydrolase family protein n=1 Tax=Streptomyces sp. NPDC056069 TaxID=3345702 RepID=UPI0035E3AA19
MTTGDKELRILHANPETADLLFAVGSPSTPELAVGTFDGSRSTVQEPLRRLHGIRQAGHTTRAVAIGSGDDIAIFLAVDEGVRSTLIRHHLQSGVSEDMKIPLGVITGPGACYQGTLRFPFSTPHEQATLAAIASTSERKARPRVTSQTRSLIPVRVEKFPAPAGSVEAIVYGAPWHTADRVVIALHGGPESHWRAGYDNSLSLLSSIGTVVAINQRGSTGYGPDHQAAIRHAWGGPDLADIHAIADHIARRRPHSDGRLMIYGASYGAYLAVLAAATHPARWSHCAAIAPFLSGELLHRDGPEAVKQLIDRLGGRTKIHGDGYGPRDLLQVAPGLRARTLLIHGGADPIIPASHSRRLYEQLCKLGQCDELEYIEALGGHSPPYDRSGRPIGGRIVEFFTRPSPAGR